MTSDSLAAALAALPTGWRGQYFEATDSTQDEARAAAGVGAPSRTIFVADYQRAGRGRQGRSWVSAPGAGLTMSVLFRESGSAPVPWRWTSLASVALVEAIAGLVPGLQPAIKWPNDVLIADRKVAGILAETTWDGQELLVIVGVGVNVDARPAELASIGPMATSLRVAGGQDIDRGQLLLAFVRAMDRWLDKPTAELHATWESRLWGRGQRLRLLDLGRVDEVVVLGVEPDGSLRVRLADGTETRTTTGELIP
jgi:BirA family biotin operon repressor/biotin-[acetyl-CoA-carboxylase] ligase